jgi:hypothetical protein
MRSLTLLVLCLASVYAFGQYTNFNTQKNWSYNKKEIIFAVGGTQFTGDLGGRDAIGKDFSMADLDLPSTSIGGHIGYRNRFHPFWTTTSILSVGQLRGNDAFTNEIVRKSRNLHFKSLFVDFTQRLEFILYANEKFGARYKFKGHHGAKNHNERFYMFSGVGAMYYNPKAQWNGTWYALRPLSTEGQGLEGGPKKYGPVTFTVPFGFGARIGLGRMWRFGVEASYVKTFSDYIDDVHGVYYDPAKLASPEAQHFSNPAIDNTTWFAPGQQRGDKNKDAYYLLNFTVSKNVTYRNYYRGNKAYQWSRGRYKF